MIGRRPNVHDMLKIGRDKLAVVVWDVDGEGVVHCRRWMKSTVESARRRRTWGGRTN